MLPVFGWGREKGRKKKGSKNPNSEFEPNLEGGKGIFPTEKKEKKETRLNRRIALRPRGARRKRGGKGGELFTISMLCPSVGGKKKRKNKGPPASC